jgi:hypothetical protein
MALTRQEARIIQAYPWIFGVGGNRRLEFRRGGRDIAIGGSGFRFVAQPLRLSAAGAAFLEPGALGRAHMAQQLISLCRLVVRPQYRNQTHQRVHIARVDPQDRAIGSFGRRVVARLRVDVGEHHLRPNLLGVRMG